MHFFYNFSTDLVALNGKKVQEGKKSLSRRIFESINAVFNKKNASK